MSGPVVIMAGGTGGHVFPGLAVADALRAESVPVTWLGAIGGMEEGLVQRQQVQKRRLQGVADQARELLAAWPDTRTGARVAASAQIPH